MTDDDQPRRWIVVFRPGEKVYTYVRTESDMIEEIKRIYAKKHVYPHRLWVVETVENEDGTKSDEIVKVEIT